MIKSRRKRWLKHEALLRNADRKWVRNPDGKIYLGKAS
jgi:hypothetical protein